MVSSMRRGPENNLDKRGLNEDGSEPVTTELLITENVWANSCYGLPEKSKRK